MGKDSKSSALRHLTHSLNLRPFGTKLYSQQVHCIDLLIGYLKLPMGLTYKS